MLYTVYCIHVVHSTCNTLYYIASLTTQSLVQMIQWGPVSGGRPHLAPPPTRTQPTPVFDQIALCQGVTLQVLILMKVICVCQFIS